MKKKLFPLLALIVLISFQISCNPSQEKQETPHPAEIIGNPEYQAISYGGYRHPTREKQPSLNDLKEDMRILAATGVKLLRTYNTSQFPQAENLLKAIHALKGNDPDFEMYVMLGAWIDCKGAWTGSPDHSEEDRENNAKEINKAVELANKYPDIVKIIAVGNEAMVKWAESYYVQPKVILKWVKYLQDLKQEGKLVENLWITSSDNFASWGGGEESYHTEDLKKLIKAVDYVSLHTYPFHDTHYNPSFWHVPENEKQLSKPEKIEAAMLRAADYAKKQYNQTAKFIHETSPEKPVHIGETGWATTSNSHYGMEGSRAADEFKQKYYYDHIRQWTNASNISCFYFEIFDEKWKDAQNAQGSENHFGLINLNGEAKYALWEMVDEGVFEGLTRNGQTIKKTYNGNLDSLMKTVGVPPEK